MGFASAELNSPPKKLSKSARFRVIRYRYRFAWKCAGVSAVLWFSTLLSAQPGVTFSPTSLSFGNQVVGVKSSAQVITLTNTGTSCLSLNAIKLSGGNRTDFSQTNTCGGSLAVNASCTISVSFDPLAIGSRTSTVSVTGRLDFHRSGSAIE